jgi:glutaredoxin-like protein NrdH
MSDLWGYGWRMGAYDFSAPHGEFQMPVERNEQGHVRVHRGVVVPRHELDNPDHFLHDYGVHWSTNEQISQALSDPAVYGEHNDDVGLLLSGWYDPAHGTHSDPDPITGGRGYNEHEQEITMPPGTPIHVDRARWKHPDWNHDRWEDLGWSPGHHTAFRLASDDRHDPDYDIVPARLRPHQLDEVPNPNKMHGRLHLLDRRGDQVGQIAWALSSLAGGPVIRYINVHPDHQGKGLARRLLDQALQYAPALQHDDEVMRTPDGASWAEANPLPRPHTAARLGGANGDLPENLHFREHQGWTHAYDGEHLIGYLRPAQGKIDMIKVAPEYRRRGIATAMLDWHRDNVDPDLGHSTDQTPLGRAWGRSVGWNPPVWNRQDPDIDTLEDYEVERGPHTAARGDDQLRQVLDRFRRSPSAKATSTPDGAVGWCEGSMDDFAHYARRRGLDVERREFNYPLKAAFPDPHPDYHALEHTDMDLPDRWNCWHHATVVHHQGKPYAVDWTMRQLDPRADHPHVEPLESYRAKFDNDSEMDYPSHYEKPEHYEDPRLLQSGVDGVDPQKHYDWLRSFFGDSWRPPTHTAARLAMPTYYHHTDDPDFQLDPGFVPENFAEDDEDYSTCPHCAADIDEDDPANWQDDNCPECGGSLSRSKPGVFVSDDPDRWASPYGEKRDYVADLDGPDLHNLPGVERVKDSGDNAYFVPADQFHHLKVKRVRPRTAARLAALPDGLHIQPEDDDWVAYHQGTPVGSLSVDYSTEVPSIDSIRVHPDYRRHGIGKALWEAAGRPAHTPDDMSADGQAWARAVGGPRLAMPAPFPAADVDLQYHHDHHYPSVTAHAGDGQIGHLEWDGPGLKDTHGEIADIHVDDDWRHRSIATAMFDLAQKHEPKLHHSDNLSDYGAAWKQYEESRTRPEQFYNHAKKARTMSAAVTVYTQPNCVQCTMTKKQLDRLGIEHRVIDVTVDPDAHAYVTGLGYQQAPVVVVGDGEQHWGGFRPDHLKGLADG